MTIQEAIIVLSISSEDTIEIIKKKYRTLIKQNHPDLFQTQGEEAKNNAEKITQKLNQAYEIIEKAFQLYSSCRCMADLLSINSTQSRFYRSASQPQQESQTDKHKKANEDENYKEPNEEFWDWPNKEQFNDFVERTGFIDEEEQYCSDIKFETPWEYEDNWKLYSLKNFIIHFVRLVNYTEKSQVWKYVFESPKLKEKSYLEFPFTIIIDDNFSGNLDSGDIVYLHMDTYGYSGFHGRYGVYDGSGIEIGISKENLYFLDYAMFPLMDKKSVDYCGCVVKSVNRTKQTCNCISVFKKNQKIDLTDELHKKLKAINEISKKYNNAYNGKDSVFRMFCTIDTKIKERLLTEVSYMPGKIDIQFATYYWSSRKHAKCGNIEIKRPFIPNEILDEILAACWGLDIALRKLKEDFPNSANNNSLYYKVELAKCIAYIRFDIIQYTKSRHFAIKVMFTPTTNISNATEEYVRKLAEKYKQSKKKQK